MLYSCYFTLARLAGSMGLPRCHCAETRKSNSRALSRSATAPSCGLTAAESPPWWVRTVRQVEPERRHQLGARRAVGAQPARRAHGRRDLRGNQVAQAAGHGVGHHGAGRSRQQKPAAASEGSDGADVQAKSTRPAARRSSPRGAKARRDHHHAPPLSVPAKANT